MGQTAFEAQIAEEWVRHTEPLAQAKAKAEQIMSTRFLDKNGEPITAARLIAETVRSDFPSADAPMIRACTCHPDEAPAPCQRQYALSECQAHAVSIAANIRAMNSSDLIAERDDLRKRLVAAEAVNLTLRSWLAQGRVDYAQGYADGLAAAAKASAVAVKSPSPQASASPQDAAVGRAITQKGQRP